MWGLHCQPQTHVSNRTLLIFARKLTRSCTKHVQHVWVGRECFWHRRRVKQPLKNCQERRELMHFLHVLCTKGCLPSLPGSAVGLQAVGPKLTPPGQKMLVLK